MKAISLFALCLLCGCQAPRFATCVPYHPGTKDHTCAIYGTDRDTCWREARRVMDEQHYVGMLRWPEFTWPEWKDDSPEAARFRGCYLMMVEFLDNVPR